MCFLFSAYFLAKGGACLLPGFLCGAVSSPIKLNVEGYTQVIDSNAFFH
jgi:hypothetical protein